MKMKRTPKVIKQQTEEWLDERWMIANMKDTRPQDMSYYMGALKALEFIGYEWKRDADGKHTLFKQIGVIEMKNNDYPKYFKNKGNDIYASYDGMRLFWYGNMEYC